MPVPDPYLIFSAPFIETDTTSKLLRKTSCPVWSSPVKMVLSHLSILLLFA